MIPIPPDSVPKNTSFSELVLLFCQKRKLIFHLCKLLEEEGAEDYSIQPKKNRALVRIPAGLGSDPTLATLVVQPGVML